MENYKAYADTQVKSTLISNIHGLGLTAIQQLKVLYERRHFKCRRFVYYANRGDSVISAEEHDTWLCKHNLRVLEEAPLIDNAKDSANHHAEEILLPEVS